MCFFFSLSAKVCRAIDTVVLLEPKLAWEGIGIMMRQKKWNRRKRKVDNDCNSLVFYIRIE